MNTSFKLLIHAFIILRTSLMTIAEITLIFDDIGTNVVDESDLAFQYWNVCPMYGIRSGLPVFNRQIMQRNGCDRKSALSQHLLFLIVVVWNTQMINNTPQEICAFALCCVVVIWRSHSYPYTSGLNHRPWENPIITVIGSDATLTNIGEYKVWSD